MSKIYNHEAILTFAVDVGELMLKSGAETYRVEDTILRILASHHFKKVDTFVTPTGIMATITDDAFPLCSTVRRVKNRSTRLDKIEAINQLSRDYVESKLALEEALALLDTIKHAPPYPPKVIVLTTGICSAFFSLMFGGGTIDFVLSFLTGIMVASILAALRQKKLINYFILFLAALFVGSVVVTASFLFAGRIHVEAIVIGGIMPLVPGVAFTNAVRDTIGDELLSGISRGVEALFVAISIAAGIGISMSVGVSLGGIL